MRQKSKFKKTPIGEIPEDWEVVRLGEIGELKDGDWILKQYYDENGDVRLLQVGDIGVGKFLDKSQRFIGKEAAQKLNVTYVKPGKHILISRMPDPIGRACIAPYLSYPYIVAVDITMLEVRDDLADIEYIMWVLNSPLSLAQAGRLSSGATRQRVSRRNLEKILIPLPSLPEQKKIAEILRTVDEAIERTERLKRGLMGELLTKGIGHKEFKKTELGRIPKEWRVVRLGNVLSPKNGERPKLSDNGAYLVDNDFAIIIGRVGASGEVHLARGKIWVSDNAIYSKGYTKNKIYLPWLYYLLKFKNLGRFATKTTHPIITQSFLNSYQLPLPPLSEQQKIAEILSTVDRRLELLRKRRKTLERIKKGLMKDLLTGRRRVRVG